MLRYRLDQTIVFGLLATWESWTLRRLDPCSVLYTGTTNTDDGLEWIGWNDYEALLRYIAAIHAVESIRDDAIEYVPGGGQMWRVPIKRVQYRLHPFFASYPLGRMTRVGIAYPTALVEDGNHTIAIEGEEMSGPVYIKLSYVNTRSQFREENLYEQAHSQGYIPGLARLVAQESRPFFVENEHGLRQKEVVVLGSGGEPLNRCDSVIELLRVTYDTIQSRSCVFLFSAAYLIGSPGGDGGPGCFASRY